MPNHIPPAIQAAINAASVKQLTDFLMCEENSAIYLFGDLTIPGTAMENGDSAVEAACQSRLDYLIREEDARELCFKRAEETRQRKPLD